MEKKFRRFLAILLTVAMILPMLPENVFASANGTEYLFLATDRHADTDIIGKLLTQMESEVGDNAIDYVGLGGDMVDNTDSYNSSTVLSEVTAVATNLDATNVDILYASHDKGCTDDAGILNKTSGEWYSGDNYYVYGVIETDVKNASSAETAAATFVEWASGLTDDKAIIVLSHFPLHANRGDNAGAGYWHNALNKVATGSEAGGDVTRNVAFLHGHNHTVDRTEYFYEVGDTMSIESYVSPSSSAYEVVNTATYDNEIQTYASANGTDATIYYTYATAGYLTESRGNGQAMLIGVSGSEITLTKYTSNSGTELGTVERITTTPTEKTVSAETTYEAEDGSLDGNGNEIAATGLGLTDVSAVFDEMDLSSTFGNGEYHVYDVALAGYSDDKVTVLFNIYNSNLTDAVIYLVAEDGTLNAIEGTTVYTAETEELAAYTTVTFEVAASEFTVAFGVPEIEILEDYKLSALKVTSEPTTTKYFKGVNDATVLPLDITGLEVTAEYSNGTDTISKVIEWNQFDTTADAYALSVDMTQIGDQDVVITYKYGDVTLTATFRITIYSKQFTADSTNVVVEVEVPGVTGIIVTENTGNSSVENALDGLATEYVSYDFELTGYNQGEAVTVTVPVPESMRPVDGEENRLAAYHITDDGIADERVFGTYADGTYTFIATQFSTWALVEMTDEAVEGESGTVADYTSTTTGTESKEVYVLVDSVNGAGDYLFVDVNSATTSANMLTAASSGVTNTSNVTVVSGTDADGNSIIYIENPDAEAIWTATANSSGYRLYNGSLGRYLRYSSGLTTSGSNSTTWYSGTNTLYRQSSNGGGPGSSSSYYYVRYSNGWGTSTSSATVYIYQKQTITIDSIVETTDTVSLNAGADQTIVIDDTTQTYTVTIDPTILFAGEDATATFEALGGSYTYAVVSDPNKILNTTTVTDGVFTLNAVEGTATIRVYYTWTVGENTYKIWDTVKITTRLPFYTVDITKAEVAEDGTKSSGESITDTVVIKGVEANDTYALWADVFYNGEEKVTVDSSQLTWSSNNEAVATVDSDGNVTFTGKDGKVQITVYYEYTNSKGETVSATDVVTFSVSQNQYTIPEDGTNDFPEYPNQGAVRFDKTATAVGNFSETGIAQVELSMTGVPYGTSTKTDVVIMVDMTASMEDNDVTAAELAVQELIETLVYDEENDVYDSNIQIFVDTFGSGSSDSAVTITSFHDCTTISNADELTAAKSKIDFTQSSQGGGTRYNIALADVYETLNREGHADNQFVIFVSDGVATAYSPLTDGAQGTTITGSNSETSSLCAGWFDDNGEITDEFQTEYYTYLIKTAGIPVYTIGANLTSGSDAADLLNHMSSNYSPDGKTSTGATNYSFFCTTSDGITEEVLGIFQGIGQDIKEAATNVVVEDKIADEYTMNFTLPSGVTAKEAGMENFYIQVVGYELDENNERKESPEVLEKFLFNSDGTITHTIGSTTCGDTCTHVTKTDDTVTAIDGTYFDYSSTSDGEFLTWTADKLDRTELALQYFVYLDNSAGSVEAADQIDAGTYPTNEYATITYTNYLGNECQQEFPVPSLTWSGAQVTYVFYLVNENGEPVNRAGKVVPFAEAVYVTDPVTYDVTWNNDEGIEKLDASYLAADIVPNVYALYDLNAYYEILVYQTEGVDSETQAKNYNHFIIEGSASGTENTVAGLTVTNLETTKVFNTKAGTKYDKYGAYSTTEGTYTSSESDISYSATVTKDVDYANTTVAFAVVWKPALVQDTVVIDFGLDVVIDVYTNDGLAAGVTGVMTSAPNGVTIDSGTYATAVGSTSITGGNGLWTASVENLTSVRFHMNKMGINAPATFYYEAGVNYYTYDTSNNATLNTTNMYSSVTVIPATTVYYEDEFIDFSSYTKDSDGNYVKDETAQWNTDGTVSSATQDVDRPGVTQSMSSAYDANNIYGYDSAYENMSTYSMGTAKKITVTASTRGVAEFTFYGTGFDVVSMTSDDTGYFIIQVYSGNSTSGTLVKTLTVDTYYGMTEDGSLSVNNPEALYQVPVMKVDLLNDYDLPYGQYTVKITAAYNDYFDHTQTEGRYDLYLDAIRIYDPTGVASGSTTNVTVSNAYEADGEGWPQYIELRNNIIEASKYNVTENEDGSVTVTGDDLEGGIFIDSSDKTTSITDYVSYGPNNELYLATGQSVAFTLNQTYASIIADVQIALKVGNGDSVTYKIYDSDKTKAANVVAKTLTTATDLYYSIKEISDGTIVIANSGENGILSITNIKVTYTQNPYGTGNSSEDTNAGIMTTSLLMDEGSATSAVMSLRKVTVSDDAVTEDTGSKDVVTEGAGNKETVTEDTENKDAVMEDTGNKNTVTDSTENEDAETEDTETEDTETEDVETEDKVTEGTEAEDTKATVIDIIKAIITTIINWVKRLFS